MFFLLSQLPVDDGDVQTQPANCEYKVSVCSEGFTFRKDKQICVVPNFISC